MINKEPNPRPRGRPRKFDRDAVLARAMMTFWQLGYEGASIADLTAAMGITPQSLYSAFNSKSQLYHEALKNYQNSSGAFTARALVEEATARAGFERMLREAAKEFSKSNRPRGCMISTAVLTCATENQDEARYVARLRKSAVDTFRRRIDRAIDEGEFQATTDSAALARYLVAVIQGMSAQAQDGATKKELLAIAEIAIQVLKQY